MVSSVSQIHNSGVQYRNLIADIKLHVKSNLVIAAASGMQLLADIADTLNQIGFDKAVNILVLQIRLQCATLHIRKDGIQSFQDQVSLSIRQDALLCQHSHMSNASANVLTEQTGIEAQGFIEAVY